MNQTLRLSSLSLVSCLGISVMLISPALAQVNGPGPSPSSAFDIVLNLPGDEAVITGAIVGESIGGTPGQTTQLNVSDGGEVGGGFFANSGGEVNIVGGILGGRFFANSGSEVNISGGFVDLGFDAASESVVNISGGTVSSSFIALSGSEVNISGGTVGNRFEAQAGSDVELIGGEFRLNGADFTGSAISLADEDVFTGTLADGSSFLFSTCNGDDLIDVTLTVAPLPPLDLNPIVINAPVVSGPSGLRTGQTLTLQAGGSLRDNFAVVNATLNVEAGIVGDETQVFDSVVNINGGTIGDSISVFSSSEVSISGGTVGNGFNALPGSEVNISGGTVGRSFNASSGSVVNISGGDVGSSFRALPGSEVNISGGNLGGNFNASSGSEVNIRGGTQDNNFDVFGGGTLNIFGSEFFIDGVELTEVLLGQAAIITDRNVTLSGVLADGEPFSFDLNSILLADSDFFDPDATLTVTLTAPFLLGDVNMDGVVDFFDIAPFIELLSSQTFQAEADIDGNGVVDFFDIQPFIDILSGQ